MTKPKNGNLRPGYRCCEGGPVCAGCYHDHCRGPVKTADPKTCKHVAKELEYISKTCIKCGYVELT